MVYYCSVQQPNSKFRNVTVADNWQYFINSTVSSNVTGVKVPGSGTVKAVVGVTGTYGDRGYSDLLNFGLLLVLCLHCPTHLQEQIMML
jgi:hypothetical protein